MSLDLNESNSHFCEPCRMRLFPKTDEVWRRHEEQHAKSPDMPCVHGYSQKDACPDCGNRGFIPNDGSPERMRPRRTGKGPPRKRVRKKDLASISQNYGPTKHEGTRIR